MGYKWKNTEEASLLALATSGETSVDIADILTSRTAGAIRRRAGLKGIQLTRTSWRIDPIARMLLLDYLKDHPGNTLVDASRVLKRTRQTLRSMARKLTREGLLQRLGGATGNCRYLVTLEWFSGICREAEYGKYLAEVKRICPHLFSIKDNC